MNESKLRNEKTTSGRRPGRPKRGQEVVTPAAIEKMATLWLQGMSLAKIGDDLGIDRTTVRHHLDNTIRPLWYEDMRSRLHEDLAKVALLERTAWERFNSSVACETHEVVEKALLEGGTKPQTVKQVMRKVTKTGEVAWIQVIQWCLDFRARIHAHYAPKRHHVDHGGELRVAGKTPSQVEEEMADRLLQKIHERRQFRIARDSDSN